MRTLLFLSLLLPMALTAQARQDTSDSGGAVAQEDLALIMRCNRAAVMATNAAELHPKDQAARAKLATAFQKAAASGKGGVVPSQDELRYALGIVDSLIDSGILARKGSPTRDLFIGQATTLCFVVALKTAP